MKLLVLCGCIYKKNLSIIDLKSFFFFFQFKYAKISSAVNGNVKKGVIFSTYSALIGESSQSGGKYKTRLKQLLQWCGDDFDGLVSF